MRSGLSTPATHQATDRRQRSRELTWAVAPLVILVIVALDEGVGVDEDQLDPAKHKRRTLERLFRPIQQGRTRKSRRRADVRSTRLQQQGRTCRQRMSWCSCAAGATAAVPPAWPAPGSSDKKGGRRCGGRPALDVLEPSESILSCPSQMSALDCRPAKCPNWQGNPPIRLSSSSPTWCSGEYLHRGEPRSQSGAESQ